MLAAVICKDKNNGLEVDINTQMKTINILQLADDTTVCVENEEAIKISLAKVENFCKVSGLRLNKDKTEGLWLGRHENRNDSFAGINWGKSMVFFLVSKRNSREKELA